MAQKEQIARIKNAVEVSIGRRISVTSKKGRKKSTVRLGTIEKAFPSIFVVKMENTSEDFSTTPRLVSYSYTDILTHSIELSFCKEEAVGE